MPSAITANISAAAAKAMPNPQAQPQISAQAHVSGDAARVAQATQAQAEREQSRVNESKPTIQIPSRVERNEKARRTKQVPGKSAGEDTKESAANSKDKIDLVA